MKLKRGAQPGNRNAAKKETARRFTIRLYERDRIMASLIARKLGISRDAAIRRAIAEYLEKLEKEQNEQH